MLDRQRLGRDRTNPAGTGQPRQGHQQVSNQPEPQRHAAPEFNALPPIRKPALRDRFVAELAIRHTQAESRELKGTTDARRKMAPKATEATCEAASCVQQTDVNLASLSLAFVRTLIAVIPDIRKQRLILS